MKRPSKAAAVPAVVWMVVQCIHVLCLFVGSDFLHDNKLNLLTYTFLVLTGSAALFITIQSAFPLLFLLTRKQLLISLCNGLLLSVSLFCYSFGLKYCGPIRAILIDFCDQLLLFLPALVCGWTTLGENRKRGLLLMLAAVLLLMLNTESSVHDAVVDGSGIGLVGAIVPSPVVPPAASIVADGGSPDDLHPASKEVVNLIKLQEQRETESAVQAAVAGLIPPTAPSHTFNFLFLSLSEGMMGMFALIAASSLTLMRKNYEKTHAKEFGGPKKFHAVSMCAGAALLSPLMLVQMLLWITSSDTTAPSLSTAAQHSVGVFSILFTLLFLIIFMVVLQFYVDSKMAQRNDTQLLTKLNLVVSVVCATAIDWWRQEQRVTLSTLLASVCIFFGVHFLITSSKREDAHSSSSSTLPLYSSPQYNKLSLSGVASSSFAREVRLMLKHFTSDSTSLRIFSFLCINFLFMFVELLYGYFSNSLGLISDAGHMLFDCTALAIGLYASFVSKIKANSQYTYGYGRYEILSGYVNGVFLLFIGYFIFVESVERLFTPPQIRGESLVMVSALGLGVNLVGLFFFHDFSHGHSHGGGGGGGHGHSHGGGHDHHEEELEEQHDSHDHHAHSHGEGADNCEHNSHGHNHSPPKKASSSSPQPKATNHNVLAIYLHILADTLGSVGVICSSLLIQYYNITSADAICSIVISVLIIGSTMPLLTSTLHILLTRTPVHKEAAVQSALTQINHLPGVVYYHSPHFWLFSDSEFVGTLHVVVKSTADTQQLLLQINELLKAKKVGVQNLTVQIEQEGHQSSSSKHKSMAQEADNGYRDNASNAVNGMYHTSHYHQHPQVQHNYMAGTLQT